VLNVRLTIDGVWLASRSGALLSSWFGLFWEHWVGDWVGAKALHLLTMVMPVGAVSSLEAYVMV
jgi:hypothetical protein